MPCSTVIEHPCGNSFIAAVSPRLCADIFDGDQIGQQAQGVSSRKLLQGTVVDVDKTIDVKKNVALDIKKNLALKLDLKGSGAFADGYADASSEKKKHTFAETETFATVTDYDATAYSESSAALQKP